MQNKTKQFRLLVDVDSVTISCPCGAQICSEGSRVADFMEKHRKHVNIEKVKETFTERAKNFLIC